MHPIGTRNEVRAVVVNAGYCVVHAPMGKISDVVRILTNNKYKRVDENSYKIVDGNIPTDGTRRLMTYNYVHSVDIRYNPTIVVNGTQLDNEGSPEILYSYPIPLSPIKEICYSKKHGLFISNVKTDMCHFNKFSPEQSRIMIPAKAKLISLCNKEATTRYRGKRGILIAIDWLHGMLASDIVTEEVKDEISRVIDERGHEVNASVDIALRTILVPYDRFYKICGWTLSTSVDRRA